MPDVREGGIAILDFGSQYTQLIARRVREQNVYAEVFPFDAPIDMITRHHPHGFILSGGPNSVYAPGAPQLPAHVLTSRLPVLGICYGMQALTHALGGAVAASAAREYGTAAIAWASDVPLFDGLTSPQPVWMSHGDRIDALPPGFVALAASGNSPFAAMGDPARRLFGVQFHPEVSNTPHGVQMLRNFLFNVCGCEAHWTAGAFIDDAIVVIQKQVGEGGRVLLALSGGVDSSVAAALLQRAIGDRLVCVFVNTGLLRKGEPEQVARVFREEQGIALIAVDATETYFDALRGVTDPEAKRKTIGRLFIDVFAEQARRLDGIEFLAQGTIYPDVIESAGSSGQSRVIKSHHNVGGLPPDLAFKLVEPLRDLFKDEVRRVGIELGLPESLVWRQPFPGPGLAVRCLGEVTWPRVETLRAADAIFTETLARAGLLRHTTDESGAVGGSSQAFAVLLPVQSVGVMGDERTYDEVIALRAVVTDDFMTADWARLSFDLLAEVSARIVNEVKGVNRVVYDITSKPPATIEWE